MEDHFLIREHLAGPDQAAVSETLFTIGNGYVGVRGLLEEDDAHPTLDSTRVHGLFNFIEGGVSPDLAPAPHWLGLTIEFDGYRFGADTSQGRVLGAERILNVRDATLTRRVLWQTAGGSVIRLTFERFASAVDQHVLVLRLSVMALHGEPQMHISGGIDTRVSLASGFQHWEPWETGSPAPDAVWVRSRTLQSGYELAMAAALVTDLDAAPALLADGAHPQVAYSAQLAQGQTITITKLVGLSTSREGGNPLADALAALERARQAGYDALYYAHRAHWERVWEDSDVVLEGDPFLQRALRFCLYHILIAAPPHDNQVSIGAKTLSGAGYRAHVFWDTELFMVQPLTLTQPHLARNLLMYRYHRLPGARAKAKANGFEGAMFPWESADTGEEVTPQWTPPDPVTGKRIRIWTGELEQHLTSDIAYAIMQYWHWTGDDAFMRDYGAEIVLDGARFWASRVEWNAAENRYEINHVIGPDEYHEDVNNNVFTNTMARWHLDTARQVWDWLSDRHPEQAAALGRTLSIDTAALDRWQTIIDRIYIPFDDERQIHIQFDGFFDLEPVDVLEYQPRIVSLPGILGHEESAHLRVIKQADVVMLMALLGEQVADQSVQRNNWETYYPLADHGSSLSPAMHAWVAARLGRLDLAGELFEHAAEIDLRDNKGNSRDGIHGASCGGLWQALVFGFAGLHLTPDGPMLDPHLPPGWERVQFAVYYQGERHTFKIEGGDVSIERG
ncbi:MAG: glycoside hydrolase family 65 protein [Chloroflexi bacterium]|nr:glycoside hydrolase family 65 protein [Chloroflexota bacterium]